MTDEIMRYLDKADHALVVAQDLMAQGHVPDAASKIYYAMFYATKALLAAEGIDVVKHSGVRHERKDRPEQPLMVFPGCRCTAGITELRLVSRVDRSIRGQGGL